MFGEGEFFSRFFAFSIIANWEEWMQFSCKWMGSTNEDVEWDRKFECLVLNPITVYSYGFLFNCTTVGQASDSMTALT